MATDSKILREYLLSLGFKVDEASNKKFDWTLGKLDLRVAGLGAGIWRVVKGTNEMVTQFARGMERMYYASMKADSSASNLAAIGYGAKQIGLSSDGMVDAISRVAMTLRMNPGMIGLAESFGVVVKGRDVSDVAKDLVREWSKMDFYVGARYAQMFGLSPEEFLLWSKQQEELKKADAERKAMAEAAGLDMDKAKAAGVEYARTLNKISEQFGILKDVLSLELLPYFREFTGLIDWTLGHLAQLTGAWAKSEGVKEHAGDTWWSKLKYLMSGDASKDALDLAKGLNVGARKATGAVGSESLPQVVARAATSIDESLQRLLPLVLKQESGGRRYGPNGGLLTSSKGAKGEMQVMDGTMMSPGYGVMGARDGSPEERARVGRDYLRAMLVKYGGDAQLALAAYNGGPAHLDGVLASGGKRNMLPETYDYVRKITGQALTLNTTVNVNGAGDPKSTGAAVAKAVNDTNSALLRNLMTVNY